MSFRPTILSKADQRDVRRAANTYPLIATVPWDGFTATLTLVPGYNELHVPHGAGQHGMELYFALVGPLGGITCGLQTMWTPIGKDTPNKGTEEEPYYSGICHVGGYRGVGQMMPPLGTALAIHWRTPLDTTDAEEEQEEEQCMVIGQPCYSDISFLAADEVMTDFVTFGAAKVYEHLKDWYDSVAARAS